METLTTAPASAGGAQPAAASTDVVAKVETVAAAVATIPAAAPVVEELKADADQIAADVGKAVAASATVADIPGAVLQAVVTDAKPMLKSKTLWGGVILILAAAMAPDAAKLAVAWQPLAGTALTVMGSVGALLVGVGRATATQALK